MNVKLELTPAEAKAVAWALERATLVTPRSKRRAMSTQWRKVSARIDPGSEAQK